MGLVVRLGFEWACVAGNLVGNFFPRIPLTKPLFLSTLFYWEYFYLSLFGGLSVVECFHIFSFLRPPSGLVCGRRLVLDYSLIVLLLVLTSLRLF